MCATLSCCLCKTAIYYCCVRGAFNVESGLASAATVCNRRLFASILMSTCGHHLYQYNIFIFADYILSFLHCSISLAQYIDQYFFSIRRGGNSPPIVKDNTLNVILNTVKMTCNKSPPPPMKLAVKSLLLLLSLTAPQLVTSFIPSNNHQLNTVKLHQKRVDHEQHSIILNCNNINDEECNFDQIDIQNNQKQQWQNQQQQKQQTERRGGGSVTSNIMGLITGQLYATKVR